MPHVHERACLTVLLDGVMTERIRGRERYCERASVLIKPGLELHDDAFGREGSVQIIIEPHDLERDPFKPYKSMFTTERFLRDAAAEGIARRLVNELDHPDSYATLAASALTYELIVTIARRGKRVRHESQQPPTWLQRTHDLLRETPGTVPTLSDLARKAGVHPAYLARAFRSCYGSSIGVFVRRLRIEAAARDLGQSGVTIASVALAHGFSDQSHFTRQFRRFIGLTPREYRRRSKESRPSVAS